MRLGSYYRQMWFADLYPGLRGQSVLDFGGYDGYFLSNLNFTHKVLVDPNYLQAFDGIKYLPYLSSFRQAEFDTIVMLDTLEYIDNKREILSKLSSLLVPGGEIYISIPHPNMKVFPSFLAKWLHRQWGHGETYGYLPEEIRNYLPSDLAVSSCDLVAESYFRFFYFPLRFIWLLNLGLGKYLVRKIYRNDRLLRGPNGHVYLKLTKTKL